MLTLLGLVIIVLAPPAAVVIMLLLVARAERARQALTARQIAVTEAIHRELGAVAAPVAERRWGGATELRISLPLESEELVGAVTAVAHRALARHDGDGARPVRIVLVPADAPARR
jgi:hypothetical protein